MPSQENRTLTRKEEIEEAVAKCSSSKQSTEPSEDYFGILYESSVNSPKCSTPDSADLPSVSQKNTNIFDEQYFASTTEMQHPSKRFPLSASTEALENDTQQPGPKTHASSGKRSKFPDDDKTKEDYYAKSVSSAFKPHQQKLDEAKRSVSHTSDVSQDSNIFDKQYFPSTDEVSSSETIVETEVHDVMTKREARSRNKVIPDVDAPKTAYDVAMKMRLGSKEQEVEGM